MLGFTPKRRPLIPEAMRDPEKARAKARAEAEAQDTDSGSPFAVLARTLGVAEDRAAAAVVACSVGLFSSLVAVFVASWMLE